MKFKLDENFGRRSVELLAAVGHDVATVAEQTLSGAADDEIIRVCAAESRCLVTLDLGFANPLRFRPRDYAGIAVVRLPHRASYPDLLQAVATLVKALETEIVIGKLWIVEMGRIRIYRPEGEEPPSEAASRA